MREIQSDKATETLRLTAGLAAAYLSNNSVPPAALPELIANVHSALSTLGGPKVMDPETLTPPVPIKKSITPDYLISLEDGKTYKSLKRHLSGRGLTPEQYREKWGLARDYPMAAPNYAKQRSELARSMGLGRKRGEPEPQPEPVKNGRRKAG